MNPGWVTTATPLRRTTSNTSGGHSEQCSIRWGGTPGGRGASSEITWAAAATASCSTQCTATGKPAWLAPVAIARSSSRLGLSAPVVMVSIILTWPNLRLASPDPKENPASMRSFNRPDPAIIVTLGWIFPESINSRNACHRSRPFPGPASWREVIP